ncbi:cupin domain-containing protein [Thalassovita sp.]|uniref:cupin domain-containing protein n=1 Tax=Thalassovita sp. TaxID=1979401 RepID=UPI0029DE7B33|nr:cupin domain-containing protein [Thalassovita sp.]
MEYAEFIQRLPSLETAFTEEDVTIRAIASDDGLVAFFHFHKDTILPPHSHLGQWGTVLEGEITLTIGDDTRTYRKGDTYDIPAGVVHSATIKAGAKAIDVFEEGDRYPLKR